MTASGPPLTSERRPARVIEAEQHLTIGVSLANQTAFRYRHIIDLTAFIH